MQYDYANKMLYIATLAFAKLSIISLLMILTASELHRNIGIGVTSFIALWGVVSEFVIAFQCGPLEPWRFIQPSSLCLDLVRSASTRTQLRPTNGVSRYSFGALWASSM